MMRNILGLHHGVHFIADSRDRSFASLRMTKLTSIPMTRAAPRLAPKKRARTWGTAKNNKVTDSQDDKTFTRFNVTYSALHRHRYRIASTQTERGDSAMDVAADHFVDQGDEYAGSAGADGMAQSYGASVDVDAIHVQAELADHA